MTTPLAILFSYQMPQCKALIVYLECSTTDHSIKLPISKIIEIKKSKDSSNPFTIFEDTLRQVQISSWKCVDTTCLFRQVKEDFHTFASRIWNVMPHDIRSTFEDPMGLKQNLESIETIGCKPNQFIFSAL